VIPICIKVIFPNWVKTVVTEASLTLLNSTISATINPFTLKLSTQTRLNLDTSIPVRLATAPLTIQFNGGDVATGIFPQIDIPAHSSVDFSISGLNILQTLATGELVVNLIQSNSIVPVQIITNPTMIILGGLSYPTSFNKTLLLLGLYKFFQANYVTVSQPTTTHGLTVQIHFSTYNPFPYSFVITNLKLSIEMTNGTILGNCNEKVQFSIGTVTSNQFSLNMNMNMTNIIYNMKMINLLGQLSFHGNFLNGTGGVSGNKIINQENVPVRRL